MYVCEINEVALTTIITRCIKSHDCFEYVLSYKDFVSLSDVHIY